MNAFFTFFDTLSNGIMNFFDYSIALAKEGVHYLLITLDFYNHAPQYFSWLPPGAANVMVAVIGIAIAYRVIGWGD